MSSEKYLPPGDFNCKAMLTPDILKVTIFVFTCYYYIHIILILHNMFPLIKKIVVYLRRENNNLVKDLLLDNWKIWMVN